MDIWALVGRFHPVLVHFPIALLVVGAALRVLRREDRAGAVCIHLGAASAVVACVAGFAYLGTDRFHGRALELILLHRNLGLAATAAAVVASLLQLTWGARRGAAQLVLAGAAALLVGATGHFGGLSVFGEDHFDTAPKPAAKAAAAARPTPPPGEAVDFVAHVRPIFEDACYRCHDARKRKGGLRLDKKKYFVQGGDGGQVVVPGKPIASKLFQLISLPKEHEDYMPSKGRALTEPEADVIRRWIEQGAHWPDDA